MLQDSPLGSALTIPAAEATTFSALLVAAAAALAWSINPGRDQLWLRQVLLDSASTIHLEGSSASLRGLNIEQALNLARASAVIDALGDKELAYHQLQGGVGFSTEVLDPVLRYLLDQNSISAREDLGVRLYRVAESSQATAGPAQLATSPIPLSVPQSQAPSPRPSSAPYAKPRRRSNRPRPRRPKG
jgi:hypothetical protein